MKILSVAIADQFETIPVESVCIPAPQTLAEVDVYDLDSQLGAPNPGSTLYRASWGYVSPAPDRSVVVLRENPHFTGFGNEQYNDPDYVKVYLAKHASSTEIPKTPAADVIFPSDGEVMVHSDQPSYWIYQNTASYYFDYEGVGEVKMVKPPAYFPFKVNSACKLGNDIFVVVNHGPGGADHVGYIVNFAYPTGSFKRESNALVAYGRVPALQCTANFLYALCADGGDNYFIVKLNRSDLSIASTVATGKTQIASMFVVDDTLVYFIQQAAGQLVDIYFLHYPATITKLTSTSVAITPTIPVAPGAGLQDTRYNFWYRAPKFYYGANGFGSTAVSITVIGDVVC